MRPAGLEDGFEKNLGFLGFLKNLKNLKSPKFWFFIFLLFFGQILYKSY